MTRKDIRAICNLGASTKGDNADAIGSKGIGFKSVFSVSDMPSIASNGFCFRFDVAAHGQLGYIVPGWVDAGTLPAPLAPHHAADGTGTGTGTGGTRIWLPFKRDGGHGGHGGAPSHSLPAAPQPNNDLGMARVCAAKFAQFEPETLLLLRRLKQLTFADATNGALKVRTVSACELGSREVPRSAGSNREHAIAQHMELTKGLRDVVTVGGGTRSGVSSAGGNPRQTIEWIQDQQHRPQGWAAGSRTSTYRLHEFLLRVPAALQCHSKSCATTTVVIGFRLSAKEEGSHGHPDAGEGGKDAHAGASAEHSVFAHLPIGKAGFRFLIQAEWLLVSSRQQLRVDSPWNLWLREQVAMSFTAAVMVDSAIREDLGRYLPSDQHIFDPFWRPAVGTIELALKHVSCLQAESGRWLAPEALLVPPREFFVVEEGSGGGDDGVDGQGGGGAGAAAGDVTSTLLSNAELLESCGMEFAKLDGGMDRTQLANLGVKDFSFAHMAAYLKRPETSQALLARPWAWLSTLYSYLHNATTTPAGVTEHGGGDAPGGDGSGALDPPQEPDAVVETLMSLRVFPCHAAEKQAPRVLSLRDATRATLPGSSVLGSGAASKAATFRGPGAGGIFTSGQSDELCRLVRRTGAAHLLAVQDAPQQIDHPFLLMMQIVPITADSAVQCVLDQHLAASFANHAQCLAGLDLVRWAVSAGGAAAGLNEQALSVLCVPDTAGMFYSPQEVHVRTILGVECCCCVSEQPGKNDNASPLHLVAFATGQGDGAEGLSQAFRRRHGKPTTVYAVSSAAGHHAADWAGGRGRPENALTSGRVRLDAVVERFGRNYVGFGHAGQAPTHPPALGVIVQDDRILCPAGVQQRGDATRRGTRDPSIEERALTVDADGEVLPAVVEGDVVTVCVDLDAQELTVALNGRLLPTCDFVCTADDLRAVPLLMCAQGGKLTVQFGSPELPQPRLDALGYKLIHARMREDTLQVRYASVASVAGALEDGGSRQAADPADASTGGGVEGRSSSRETGGLECIDALQWEAFLLHIGCRPHYTVCRQRHWWNSFGKGVHVDCAICMLPLCDSNSRAAAGTSDGLRGLGLISVINCKHRFHQLCCETWKATKPICPICRTPITSTRSYPPWQELSENVLSNAFAKLVSTRSSAPLQSLMRLYSCDAFPRLLVSAIPVASSHGLRPLGKVFSAKFSVYGEDLLPYFTMVGSTVDEDVLSSFGYSATINVGTVLAAIKAMVSAALDANQVYSDEQVRDSFNSMYGLLDRLLAEFESSQRRQGTRTLAAPPDSATPDAAAGGAAVVRKAFQEQPLILVCGQGSRNGGHSARGGEAAAAARRHFVRTSEALWDGDAAVALALRKPRLQQHYASLKPLFKGQLQIPSADFSACCKSLWQAWDSVLCDAEEGRHRPHLDQPEWRETPQCHTLLRLYSALEIFASGLALDVSEGPGAKLLRQVPLPVHVSLGPAGGAALGAAARQLAGVAGRASSNFRVLTLRPGAARAVYWHPQNSDHALHWFRQDDSDDVVAAFLPQVPCGLTGFFFANTPQLLKRLVAADIVSPLLDLVHFGEYQTAPRRSTHATFTCVAQSLIADRLPPSFATDVHPSVVTLATADEILLPVTFAFLGATHKQHVRKHWVVQERDIVISASGDHAAMVGRACAALNHYVRLCMQEWGTSFEHALVDSFTPEEVAARYSRHQDLALDALPAVDPAAVLSTDTGGWGPPAARALPGTADGGQATQHGVPTDAAPPIGREVQAPSEDTAAAAQPPLAQALSPSALPTSLQSVCGPILAGLKPVLAALRAFEASVHNADDGHVYEPAQLHRVKTMFAELNQLVHGMMEILDGLRQTRHLGATPPP